MVFHRIARQSETRPYGLWRPEPFRGPSGPIALAGSQPQRWSSGEAERS